MDQPTREIPQPPPSVVKEAVNTEAIDLHQEYKASSRIGREVMDVVRYREDTRLTPYNDPRRFSRDAAYAVRNRRQDEELTVQDVITARRGSFGLVLEAATQIAEAQLPRTGQVREDLDSLEALAKVIKRGYSLAMDLHKEDHQGVIEQAKAAIAKRGKVTPDQVNWDDKKIGEWIGQQFGAANQRLGRGVQIMKAYRER